MLDNIAKNFQREFYFFTLVKQGDILIVQGSALRVMARTENGDLLVADLRNIKIPLTKIDFKTYSKLKKDKMVNIGNVKDNPILKLLYS